MCKLHAIERVCEAEGCSRPYKARGYCQTHYRRLQRQGTVEDQKRCHAPAHERVLRSTKRVNQCLEFQGSKNDLGYGSVRVGGATKLAHRVIAEHHFGEEEVEGLIVCHKCDNPSCVEISHLFLGTHSDNAQDREDKGRGQDIRGENNPQHKVKRLR